MFIFDQLQYHCSQAELTPDLISHIRHFPVRQALSQFPARWTLVIANNFMDFAKFIPLLVCTPGTDGEPVINN